MVDIECEGQTVVQNAEIDTSVPSGGLLPCQCLIETIRTSGCTITEEIVVSSLDIRCVGRDIAEVADTFLLTGDTPA